MTMATFDAPLEKGEQGFGIYFTKNYEGRVVVEGFVSSENNDVGSAERLGIIAIDDVLERINGVNVTDMDTAQVIQLLRDTPQGLNVLTLRRPEPPLEDDVKSDAWWREFEALREAELARWNASLLTESEFCDYLYNESDAQQKSYLRQQYPTLLAHYQRQFSEWPSATLVCKPTAYQCPALTAGSRQASVIAPSACLTTLLDCIRVKFGWTRDETNAFIQTLQSQHGIISTLDLVCLLRHIDGIKPLLQQSARQSFPRLTNRMWVFMIESALHGLSPEELTYVDQFSRQ
ncbi:hypothetical protein LEN26_012301 [Aphanomyces euteiches]|nr:hypothetical protein LEN26_012301 [Aphanomyces euteiches]KAH9126629.1 hypothetical protein AeMF1_002958 [Aphanomyces euteiches]